MGPRTLPRCNSAERSGWGRRIRTPATWSRATRPTTRRSPKVPRRRANYSIRSMASQRTEVQRSAPTNRSPTTAAYRTALFSARLGRKRGTLAGGILISLPVRGLRPFRAARLVTTNVPNPEMVTRRPRRSDSTMPQTKAFMARSAEIFEPPELFAMIATSSAFVISNLALSVACRGVGVNRDVTSGRHAAHGIEKERGLEGLFDDECARFADEREGLAVRGVAGDEDEARAERWIARGRVAIELLAVAVGHPDVGHDQVVALAAYALEGLAAAGGHVDAPAGLAQDRHDEVEHARLVLHDERRAAVA